MSRIRPVTEADYYAVNRIADTVHLLYEREEVIVQKMTVYPEGCFVLETAEVSGYALSHPWMLGGAPCLNQFIKLPYKPDCLFIHDIALLPEARGQGTAKAFLDTITDCARRSGYAHISLVAVYGTERLWSRFGFRKIDIGWLGYGADAAYMVLKIS